MPVIGMLELDHMSSIVSQLEALNKRFDRLKREKISAVQNNIVCGNCVGEHGMTECPMAGASTSE